MIGAVSHLGSSTVVKQNLHGPWECGPQFVASNDSMLNFKKCPTKAKKDQRRAHLHRPDNDSRILGRRGKKFSIVWELNEPHLINMSFQGYQCLPRYLIPERRKKGIFLRKVAVRAKKWCRGEEQTCRSGGLRTVRVLTAGHCGKRSCFFESPAPVSARFPVCFLGSWTSVAQTLRHTVVRSFSTR